MAKKVKKVADSDLTPEQQEMADIRAVPRGQRSDDQKARLKDLQAAEGRRRFKALAGKRLERVEKALKTLASCGNRNAYTYTDNEATFILETVDKATSQLMQAFIPGSNGETSGRTYPWQL